MELGVNKFYRMSIAYIWQYNNMVSH